MRQSLRRTLLRWIGVAIVAGSLTHGDVASANDRVAELTKMLSSSSNDKARLAAVASLGRLGDKRAMKPLVTALTDPSAQVRMVAAAALGKLGHKAALPLLKTVATDDMDELVRGSAREAAILVAKANQLPDPWPVNVGVAPAKPTKAARKANRAGFGNQPRALENQTELYLVINSSADDSPGKADKTTRQVNAEILRNFLMERFRANPVVTTVAADAKKLSLDERHLDLSVTKLDVVTTSTMVEIDAQLRFAISDSTGKMLSFVSGGAKVQVSRKTFNPKYLPNLRREALEGAMRGLYDKLLLQLRDRSQS
ncbi:MAG: HEAT repeat domain-containing protein [Myxococcota bacterium]|nr:HEAT repeat domain-containing protein [Myxococcota bacterium]